MIRKFTVVFAGIALALGLASTAEAKSISRIPAQCSAGTAGSALFLSAGARTQLGFGANGDGSLGTWHILAEDFDGTTFLDYTTSMSTPAWTVVTQRDVAKGSHSVAITASNLTTGEVCTSQLSWKV